MTCILKVNNPNFDIMNLIFVFRFACFIILYLKLGR